MFDISGVEKGLGCHCHYHLTATAVGRLCEDESGTGTELGMRGTDCISLALPQHFT